MYRVNVTFESGNYVLDTPQDCDLVSDVAAAAATIHDVGLHLHSADADEHGSHRSASCRC